MTSNPYTGPMFEILAGPQQKSILAHADILQKSDKVRPLIEGDWKDSAERRFPLTDWDEETVVRLVEWLYTEDYDCPFPKRLSSVYSVVPSQGPYHPSVPEFQLSKTEIFRSLVGDRKGDVGSVMAELCSGRAKPFADQSPNPRNPGRSPFSQDKFVAWALCCMEKASWAPETSGRFHYEEALFVHAKLYCLADYMLLPKLQDLALQHLELILIFIQHPTADSPAVGNIVNLAMYVYANTSSRPSGEEPLRDMITTFITYHFSAFIAGEPGEIQYLMAEEMDFFDDICSKLGTIVEAKKTNDKKLKEANAESKEANEKLEEAMKEIRKLKGQVDGGWIFD